MRTDVPGLGIEQAAMEMQFAGSQPYQPTMRERLLGRKAELTQRLADVNAAIEALDGNPDFEKTLNVLGKANL